jgi:hypothetical protein
VTLSYFAGTRLTTQTFDALFAQVPRTFTKATDQLYNTTTTLQNDEFLTCSLDANSTYEVAVFLVMSGTAGDIVTAWSAPSGATGYKICHGPALTSTDRSDTTMASAAHNLGTLRGYGLNHATNYAGAVERGEVVTATAGTLTIQHTQNSSNAAPSGVVTNSFMTVRKIS